jgi:hypothetical protein
MQVKVQPNVITISEFGLDLKINSNYLIHQMMDDDGKRMLRDMMSTTLDGILMQLVNDYESFTTEKKETIKEGKLIVKSLHMFATFIRQVMPVCFSFELERYYDMQSKTKKEVIDVETQRIKATFPNRWTDKNETVIITPLELILFISDKIK